MAFWSTIKPITRDLSDEAMPIGDLSAQDSLRNGDFVSSAKAALSSVKDRLQSRSFNPFDLFLQNDGSSSGKQVSSVPAAAQSIDYLNADLSKHYGMDSATAYAEAMSNTAYQRAVKDMQAAGLNPALLAQGSYAQPAGSGYVSGSSGGRSYGTSAKSVSQSDKSGFWQGLASLAVAAGVFAATKSKVGAAAAAVTAKSLATVAGQSVKAMTKR